MTFDPVAEAKRVLAENNIVSWRDKVCAEEQRLGRTLTLNELIELAKSHTMSAEEIEAQRASWAKQMMD